jgi:hypothetical protein
MKTFLVTVLALLAFFRVSAQVTVQITTDQDEFLPGEAVPLTVKITNRSGQLVHLGNDPAWLTFSVESADGLIVVKNAEVPVLDSLDLESSQMGILRQINIQPYFTLSQPGRYKVTATLRVKAWGMQMTSPVKIFDVISGVKLWTTVFGLPTTSGLPQMRKYSLEEANFLRDQLRLYVQVGDTEESQVFNVTALGPMVAFGQPEAKVDRLSRLHVLWQTGGRTFSSSVVNTDGTVALQDTYDTFTGRPHLAVTDSGDVAVTGGNRRPHPGEMPVVKQPDQLPPVSLAPPVLPAPAVPATSTN